jgi:putative oxidoreductase
VNALPHLLAEAAYADNYLDGFNLVLLLARVFLGVTLFIHGYYKFFMGGKIAGTARWFSSIGMKPNGTIHALMAASTEVGCGVLMAAGFLTPFAAAGFVSLMIVAAWTVHRPNGYRSGNDGWEYNSVLATFAVVVAALGPGEHSLDWALGLDLSFNPYSGLLIALGVGVSGGVGLLAACYRPDKDEA